jgi:hypothetical protein
VDCTRGPTLGSCRPVAPRQSPERSTTSDSLVPKDGSTAASGPEWSTTSNTLVPKGPVAPRQSPDVRPHRTLSCRKARSHLARARMSDHIGHSRAEGRLHSCFGPGVVDHIGQNNQTPLSPPRKLRRQCARMCGRRGVNGGRTSGWSSFCGGSADGPRPHGRSRSSSCTPIGQPSARQPVNRLAKAPMWTSSESRATLRRNHSRPGMASRRTASMVGRLRF